MITNISASLSTEGRVVSAGHDTVGGEWLSAERAVGAATETGHDAAPAEQVTTHTRTQASPGAQSVQTEDAPLVRSNIAPGIVTVIIIHVRLVIRRRWSVESVQKAQEELSGGHNTE